MHTFADFTLVPTAQALFVPKPFTAKYARYTELAQPAVGIGS